MRARSITGRPLAIAVSKYMKLNFAMSRVITGWGGSSQRSGTGVTRGW